MKKINGRDSYLIAAIILGILGVLTVILEIVSSGSETTRTETTLFGILEFVFSVGFAWMLARTTFRKEFEEHQKSFAVAAYRRIREIERTMSRLLSRTKSKIRDSSDELKNELEVIQEIAVGVCDTARSSIGDWSDIIGDEISTIDKIEELRSREQQLLKEPDILDLKTTSLNQEEIKSDISIEIQDLERLQQDLIDSLPSTLKFTTKEERDIERPSRQLFDLLQRDYKKDGYIEFDGFWESESGFDGQFSEITPENKLNVRIGDASRRQSIFLVLDSSEKPIGMLIYKYRFTGPSCDYGEFMSAVVRTLQQSEFTIQITSVAEQKIGKRVYFETKSATQES